MQINQAGFKTIEDRDLIVLQRDGGKKYKSGNHDDQLTTSGNLKVQYRKPTGEMLQCQHCDFTTTRSHNLIAHSRKNTGEKYLQCQHCEYTTIYSCALKTHSRKHTGEMLQCQHCKYATVYLVPL